MTNIFINPLKRIKWKLLLTIFLTLFIPVLWRTIRMHFIGSMPNTYAFSMAGNLQWINVIFEVLEEAFLLPLFYIFGTLIKNKDKDLNKKITGKLYLITIIYIIVIIIAIIFAPQLLHAMSPGTYNAETILFIRLEFANRLFKMLIKVALTLMILLDMWKYILIFLTVQTATAIITDTFVISNIPVSLKVGIKGIAIDDLGIAGIFSFIAIGIILFKLKYTKNDIFHPIFKGGHSGWVQVIISGAESLVRNTFFIIFVIKIVNRLGNGYNQGDFWVTNNFMWDWLLLPIIALGQYANRDSALTRGIEISFWQKYGGLFIITTSIIIVWLIFMPTYAPFIQYVMNNPRYEIINHLVFITIGFYILFAYNNLIDKSLYGDGKAELMLIQSIFTNVVVYLPFYFCLDTMTIDMLAIMFGTAMGVDSILTFIMFAFYKRGWLDKLYTKLKIEKGGQNEVLK